MIRVVFSVILAAAAAAAQVPVSGAVAPPAQSQSGESQEADAGEPGRVEGAVLLAGSEAPVRNAQVSLTGPKMTIPLIAATGEHGRFAVENVPPGEYNFSVSHARFVPADESGDSGAIASRRITVAEGQTVKGVVFKMMPGAVVTGRVYDEYGDPQPRARVSLQRRRYVNGKMQLMPLNGDSTDDRGEYRIFNVPPGQYYLSAQYEENRWGREARQAKADESSYPPLFYPGVLESDSAQKLNLRAGEERQGMDFRLVRDRAVRVSGRVLEGGKPARQAYVMLLESGSSHFDRKNQGADPKTGEFEFAGIRPGNYVVQAMKMGPNPGDRLQGRVEVQVASANVEGVVINLGAGAEVPGQVIIEAAGAEAPDLEERQIAVFLEPVGLGAIGSRGFGTVKPDGSFTLSEVMPGRYRVRVSRLPDGGYLSGALFGDQDVHGREFEVVEGVQGPLTVRIRMSAATVEGSVEDEDGRPLPDTKVLLAPELSRRDRSDLFLFGSTDQYGKFSFRNVVPGEYRAWAFERLEYGQHLDPDFLAAIEDEGEKVETEDNGSHTVKLKVTAAPE